jgi:superfamily II DNA or RNA helicase
MFQDLNQHISSTGNPRQFIQRRGRVLRNQINFAVIHDLVVVPNMMTNLLLKWQKYDALELLLLISLI